VARIRKQRFDRPFFDLPSRVHHHHALRHFGHHSQIVGDQHDRSTGPGFELAHQVEDLRLYGDVERRGRLVGDQQPGLAGKRHRDHDPLPHTTRKLMRILRHAPLRFRDLDQSQHLDRASHGVFAREAAMQHQHFSDLSADGQHRIERSHRLLEDHGNGIATHLPHLRFRQLEQIAPLEHNAPLDGSSGWGCDQAQNRKRGDAFAATGLADDGQRLPARNRKGNTVDGAHDAIAGEKIGLQSLDIKQRGSRHVGCFHGFTCVERAAGRAHRACRRRAGSPRAPSATNRCPETG